MSARAERLQRIAGMMREVQADCENESWSIGGKSARSALEMQAVADHFTNLLAEISAVANAVEMLAQDLEVFEEKGLMATQREIDD